MNIKSLVNSQLVIEAFNKLSARHQIFAEHILKGEAPGQAVISTGYQVKNAQNASRRAYELLQRPDISHALSLRYEELRKNSDISLNEVKGNARLILERCTQAAPVIDKKTGEPTGDWTFDASGANKANDTLMRLAGLDKTDTGARTQIQFNVSVSRPEEVKAIADEVIGSLPSPDTKAIE